MSRADKRQRQKENSRRAREERERQERLARRKRLGIRIAVATLVVVGLVALLQVLRGGDDNGADDEDVDVTEPADPTDATDPDEPLEPVDYPDGCTDAVPEAAEAERPSYDAVPAMTIDPARTYTAVMETSCGTVTIELDTEHAPETANAFVTLARDGFYDGLTFHRVARDFVVQGGDPAGDGTGGPGFSLPDEPPPDGYRAGSVAMANSGPGTTGSQFFLTWTDEGASSLGGPPYLYNSLGEVVDGLDVVETLGSLYDPAQDPAVPSSQGTAVPLYIFSVEIEEAG